MRQIVLAIGYQTSDERRNSYKGFPGCAERRGSVITGGWHRLSKQGGVGMCLACQKEAAKKERLQMPSANWLEPTVLLTPFVNPTLIGINLWSIVLLSELIAKVKGTDNILPRKLCKPQSYRRLNRSKDLST